MWGLGERVISFPPPLIYNIYNINIYTRGTHILVHQRPGLQKVGGRHGGRDVEHGIREGYLLPLPLAADCLEHGLLLGAVHLFLFFGLVLYVVCGLVGRGFVFKLNVCVCVLKNGWGVMGGRSWNRRNKN